MSCSWFWFTFTVFPTYIQVALIINGKVRFSFLSLLRSLTLHLLLYSATSFLFALHPLLHSYSPASSLTPYTHTQSLGFALDDSIKEKFLELSLACKSVICCRYTFTPSSFIYPHPSLPSPLPPITPPSFYSAECLRCRKQTL